MQLKWFHQFQFAGFYAAIEQGYFRRAGLDVKLIEGGPTIDPTTVVTKGGAEFGIGNSTLLIDYNNGHPVMAVSAIFQHSPFVIIARRDEDIRTVKDLEGHTLMGETHAAELTTYLKLTGVQLDKVKMVPHTGTMASLVKDDPDGIDSATAYTSIEPYFALKWNIPYQIFNPRDLKIDFYADTLFTSKGFATKHPEVVVSMRDALAKGWQYASSNQDEIISLILQKYHSQRNIDRLSLTFEAQTINSLLGKEIVDIGYMSLSRWQNIGEIFSKAGELPSNYSLDGFLFEIDEPLPSWVYYSFWVASGVIILVIIISVYIVNLNKKLASSLKQVSDRTGELEVEIVTRKQREKDLEEALSQIKTLKGFIPICSSCKNIRKDDGYWQKIESYVSEHSEAEFSHSICPDCAKKLYPDLNLDKNK